jgi:hypothetical protein
MGMHYLQEPLFGNSNNTQQYPTLGAGFHNVGRGVLRASNVAMINKIEAHYGERCGHIPIDAEQAFLLVETPTPAIGQQVAYLEQIFQKELRMTNFADLADLQREAHQTLVVPYIHVPETDRQIRDLLGEQVEIWGLPASMVDLLKNKASFYTFTSEIQLPGFALPEYRIASVHDLLPATLALLKEIEELYARADLSAHYPLGVMLRGAESDGNYGSSLLTMQNGQITIIPDGDASHCTTATDWTTALEIARNQLTATMNVEREERIVISRFLDLEDSPGMSLVLQRGEIASLGWNGQLQLDGSKACVGTISYIPKNDYLNSLQEEGEGETERFFTTFLRQAASKCNIPFNEVRGIANLDIMLPGPLERELQQRLHRPQAPYLAECNPRWTNYTDAILAVLNANRRTPTIAAMRDVIREGIFTIDKHPLPERLDPVLVRAHLLEQDEAMREDGIKIISRMTHNPMGLILAGDRTRARGELDRIVMMLAGEPSRV